MTQTVTSKSIEVILRAMLQAWCDNLNKTDEDREKDGEPHEIYRPYAEDEDTAYTMHLFDHWGNDLMGMASELGFANELIDGKFQVIELPEAPSPAHWWRTGEYNWPGGIQVWEPGYWHAPLPDGPEEGPPVE